MKKLMSFAAVALLAAGCSTVQPSFVGPAGPEGPSGPMGI